MNTFAGLVIAISCIHGAIASEISVKEIREGEYEFVLTDPMRMSESEAKSKIFNAANLTCKGMTPVLGKYHFHSEELISGGEEPSIESKGFRFVQEVLCSSKAIAEESARAPMLRSEEDRRDVEREVKGMSEKYFNLIASREFDAALALVDLGGMNVSKEDWVDQRSAFQAAAGEPVQISIYKITIYDNSPEAPKPGLYVAADYSNAFEGVPFHCGYLMWHRSDGGEFTITREESGQVTSEDLKQIPAAHIPIIKERLRCDAP